MLDYKDLTEAAANCTKCDLCLKRKNVVLGEGSINSEIMFIGEGPGEVEDNLGRPFVGPAGKLLDKMIDAIGLKREDVYICNIVKCRPPQNRVPTKDEMDKCMDFLRNQVAIVRPKIIVCLGATAAKGIISSDFQITRQRGQWIERKGYKIIATFHPAALLRDTTKKIPAWEDFKRIREEIKEEN
jgi:DNA polymerase